MATFYFHIRHTGGLVKDPDGSECVNLVAAIAEARKDVRAIVSDRIRAGSKVEPWSIEVANLNGSKLAEVRFHDIVRECLES